MSQLNKLLVVWSSADREVALHNVFMYTHNAKKNAWWDEVRLLLWGPSDRLGVSEELEVLGVNVFYVGVALSEMLKEGWTTLTY